MRSFASDNNSSVHPRVWAAMAAANVDHALGYGDDEWTARAQEAFRSAFGAEAKAFFVFNGTGANSVALQAVCPPWGAILCAEQAHIYNDECGAPARMTGAALVTVPTADGKLSPELLEPRLCTRGIVHHSQPKAVYVSQTTELGTVYSRSEMAALAAWAHSRGLLLHVDGARLANAAAAMGCSLAEAVEGADILSLGGTKNGMMMGEAVVVLREELAETLPWIRKQSAQLASKMRYLAAGFVPYLSAGEDGGEALWLENARHANAMATRLAEVLERAGAKMWQPVESNQIFCTLPEELEKRLAERYFFYVHHSVARFVTSWDTTEQDIEKFSLCL